MAEKYQNMNQGLISYLNNQDFNEATVKDLKQLNNNSLDTVFGVDEDGNIDIEKVRTFLAAANNVNPEDINDEKVQTFIDNFSTGMTDAVNQATDIIPSTISSKIKTGLVDSLKIGDIAKVG
jgi:Ca2+-binding EF-hand superfamily protein